MPKATLVDWPSLRGKWTLEALGRAGDAVGNLDQRQRSRPALRPARELGMATVAITGAGGGKAPVEADHWVGVPSDDTPRIQEAHIMIGHICSELVEAALLGRREQPQRKLRSA